MKKKVMIIDDAAAIREVVELTLKSSDYDVLQAHDGEDALNKLDGANVDCIVCDVNMPVMDGITFLKKIKNDDKYSSFKFIPIVMLTTEAGEEKKKEGEELGAKAWLVKPFTPEILVSAMDKVIL